jgi:PAS domain S-box-containing protein
LRHDKPAFPSVALKIFLGFSAVLLAFGLVAVYSIYKMDHVRARLVLISDTYVPLVQVLSQALSLQNREEEWLKTIEENPQALQFGLSRIPKKLPENLNRARALLDSVNNPASRFDEDLIATTTRRLDELIKDAEAYMARRTELELRAAAKQSPNTEVLRDLRDRQRRLGLKLSELLRYMQLRVKNAADRAQEVGTNSTIAVGLLSILALFIGLGIAAMAGFTLRPLSLLTEAARALGGGRMPTLPKTSGTDEIGILTQEFGRMVLSLRAKEQKLHEQNRALEALTRYNTDIIRSISTGIVVVNKDGAVRDANPAAALLFGLPPEVQGHALDSLPVVSLLPKETQEQLRAEIQRALGQSPGKPQAIRAVLYRVQGRERWVDLRAVPFADANGDIEGVLLLSEDTTEELRAKERLLRSERLATVGRMAAQVAHEIRNPLSSIGLNAELLEDDLAHTEEGRRLLKAIQSEVDRLAAITEEYLRYARLPIPQLRPLSLHGFLSSLCDFLRPETEARKVQLRLQLSPGELELRADESQLRQALLNLIRNAFEALSEKGTLVLLRASREEEFAEIAVTDDGPGIPEEVLPRIFEPFFSTKSGGTGLGLALTQQLIEGHGGQLSVKTSPNGTTFLLRLPLRPPEPSSEESALRD